MRVLTSMLFRLSDWNFFFGVCVYVCIINFSYLPPASSSEIAALATGHRVSCSSFGSSSPATSAYQCVHTPSSLYMTRSRYS